MSEMKHFFYFPLIVLLLLLSQSLTSSAHQVVLNPNLRHYHGKQIAQKHKDILTSLELAQKPRIYVRIRAGGGGGGGTYRPRGGSSSSPSSSSWAIVKRPSFHV
ncbi:hypothetical protein TorRG33x02_049130 [Trema orientale]|uniref:Transmembrane protein n=1 Tax=Trema orientale TaxID=63057 RepID=A0A2P5FNP7_TREOI|nr:hypothetical protein TorRG33x02_049130 [Trema orientale]